MSDPDFANLIEWSKKFGFNPSLTEMKAMEKLINPQTKAMWRHLTTHVVPKDESYIKRKQYLLYFLKNQRGQCEKINVKVNSGLELNEQIKRQELKLKIESVKRKVEDKREALKNAVQNNYDSFVKELENRRKLREEVKKLKTVKKKNEMLKDEVKLLQEFEGIIQNFLKSPVSYQDAQNDIRLLTNEINVCVAMKNFDLTSIGNSPFNITNQLSQISPSGIHLKVTTDLMNAHFDSSLSTLFKNRNLLHQTQTKSLEMKLCKTVKLHLEKEVELQNAKKRRDLLENEYNQMLDNQYHCLILKLANDTNSVELKDLLQNAGQTVFNKEKLLQFDNLTRMWISDEDITAKFEFLGKRLNTIFESIEEKQKNIKMYLTTDLSQSLLQFQNRFKEFINTFDPPFTPEPLIDEILLFIKTPILPPVQPHSELSDYHWKLLQKALKRKPPNLNVQSIIRKPQSDVPIPFSPQPNELNYDIAALETEYSMATELLQFWIDEPFNALFKEDYDNFKQLMEVKEKALKLNNELSRGTNVDEDED